MPIRSKQRRRKIEEKRIRGLRTREISSRGDMANEEKKREPLRSQRSNCKREKGKRGLKIPEEWDVFIEGAGRWNSRRKG